MEVTPPDAALWARAVSGDRTAFMVFYERHAARVFAHCAYRLGSHADAEDVASEAFVIAWSHRDRVKLHADADILPWLLATANRLLSQHHRLAARDRRMITKLPRLEPGRDIAIDIVDQDDLDQRQRRALAAVRSLSPEDREIIELRVMADLPATVVARSMGMPASTIGSRLARAMKRARRAYRELGTNDQTDLRSEVIE